MNVQGQSQLSNLKTILMFGVLLLTFLFLMVFMIKSFSNPTVPTVSPPGIVEYLDHYIDREMELDLALKNISTEPLSNITAYLGGDFEGASVGFINQTISSNESLTFTLDLTGSKLKKGRNYVGEVRLSYTGNTSVRKNVTINLLGRFD